MLADDLDLDALAHQGLQDAVVRHRLERRQTPIREVTQARTKAVAEHSAEREDMVGCAASVGKMGVDFKRAIMMEEPIEDIGRFVRRSGDHLHVIRRILVGHMGVEREAGINPVPRVEIARARAAPA